jgi:NADPH-dependent glutamate synthase beta subunit-like oxidoreductase
MLRGQSIARDQARGSEFEQSADVLLIAYASDPVPFPKGSDLAQVKVNNWGGVVVDDNQMTSGPGVFVEKAYERGYLAENSFADRPEFAERWTEQRW